MIIRDNPRPLKLQSASRVTGAVLTIRIDDYKIFVLTKVTSNHTNRRPSHSKCLSRLLSPLQIQLKSNRTGAVLTITINIYKTVVLTKVTSNHTNRRSSHFKCSSGLIFLLQIQLKSNRTSSVLTYKIYHISYIIYSSSWSHIFHP